MNDLEAMRALGVSPQLMRGINCFLPTGGATSKALFDAVAYGPKADPGIVQVVVLKIRRKFDAHSIQILTRAGVGYELAPGSLDKLKALLGREDHKQVVGA